MANTAEPPAPGGFNILTIASTVSAVDIQGAVSTEGSVSLSSIAGAVGVGEDELSPDHFLFNFLQADILDEPEEPDADADDTAAGSTYVVTGRGDTIRAGEGDDILINHGTGEDSVWLFGNGGDDTFVNGHGFNVMIGGAGDDRFVIDSARLGNADQASTPNIEIREFESGSDAGDVIDLRGLGIESFEDLQEIAEFSDSWYLPGRKEAVVQLNEDVRLYVYTSSDAEFSADDFTFDSVLGLPDGAPAYPEHADSAPSSPDPGDGDPDEPNDPLEDPLPDTVADGPNNPQTFVVTGISDAVHGGDGDDILINHGNGEDSVWLFGNGGNDTFVNGHGFNVMYGGDGDDRFIIDYARLGNADQASTPNISIREFESGADAGDVIDLRGFGIDSFEDLQNFAEFRDAPFVPGHKEAVVHLDQGVTLYIHSASDIEFTADDFTFDSVLGLPDATPDYPAVDPLPEPGDVPPDADPGPPDPTETPPEPDDPAWQSVQIGTAERDFFSGTDGADWLDGGGGNDTLRSGDGDDILIGGGGDDALRGGAGNDIFVAGAGDDSVYTGIGDDRVRIEYNPGDKTHLTFDGHLTQGDTIDLVGFGISDFAELMLYADLELAELVPQVTYFTFPFGVEIKVTRNLNELSPDLFVFYDEPGSSDPTNIDLAGDIDLATGTDAADVFATGAGNDYLFGAGGHDNLNGGDGDDFLRGGTGNDNLDGGDGIDVASYEEASGAVVVALANAGNGTAVVGDDTDQLIGIENIRGSDHDDTIIGNTGANLLVGGAGNDFINGGDGDDFIIGGSGSDTLVGGRGDDTLMGGYGDDVFVFNKGDGTDTISRFSIDGAQLENDVIDLRGFGLSSYEELWPLMFETESASYSSNSWHKPKAVHIELGGGDVLILDGIKLSYLTSDNFNFDSEDSLVDTNITGTSGDDTLVAGDGDVDVRMWGYEGNDTLTGGLGDDHLSGDDGDDILNGGAGDDDLRGQGGGDILHDGHGNDSVSGGTGADQFFVGAGNDELHGGDGDDLFHFSDGSDHNKILDFDAGEGSEDRIDISDFGFTSFDELLAVTNDGPNSVVQLDDDDSLTLVGVRAHELHEDDFIFA